MPGVDPTKRPLGLGGNLQPPAKKAKPGSNRAKLWIREQFGDDGKCFHCSGSMGMSNTTWLKQHLFNVRKCNFLNSTVAELLAKTIPEVRQERVNAGLGPSGAASSIINGSSSASGSRLLQGLRADVVTPADQKLLQQKFAEMVYDTNLPHSWAEHPSVIELFKLLKPAFIPPTRYQISGPLLKSAYNSVATKVQDHLAGSKYITLTMDGWSRTQGSTHVINFMACGPAFSIFLHSETAEAERVTSSFLAQATLDTIQASKFNTEEGPEVVALVTDMPNVMKATWDKLTKELPGLICIGCFCHVLDLFLKDIGTKVKEVKKVLDQAQTVVKHFKRNAIPSDLLQDQQQQLGVKHALVMIVITRFATHVNTLRSLVANQRALKQTVATEKYEKHTGRTSTITTIVNCAQFCEDANAIIKLLEPVAKHITILQSNSAHLSDAYFAVVDIDEHMAAAAVEEVYMTSTIGGSIEEIQKLWEQRREYGWHAALPAAALLDQRYRQRAASMEPAHRQTAEQLIKAMGGAKALVQLSKLRHKPIDIGIDKDTALDPQVCPAVAPLDWWADNGSLCPELAEVAQKLLSIPPTAAGGERNWSTWSNIWSDNRSCLLMGRVAMLDYVHYNSRMLRSMARPSPDLDFGHFLAQLSEMPVDEDADVAEKAAEAGEEEDMDDE